MIEKLKVHLARNGITKQLIANNASQFISSEFMKFTKSWCTDHSTVLPYNSKANGKMEAAVKVAKPMLCTIAKTGHDRYLALLL